MAIPDIRFSPEIVEKRTFLPRWGFSAQPAIGANVLENGTNDSKNSNCILESMS